jgi:hypothetical protein
VLLRTTNVLLLNQDRRLRLSKAVRHKRHIVVGRQNGLHR